MLTGKLSGLSPMDLGTRPPIFLLLLNGEQLSMYYLSIPYFSKRRILIVL